MTGKTDENMQRKSAQNNACGKGALYVYSLNTALFGASHGESPFNAANDLAVKWKTIRAAIPRQRNAALGATKGRFVRHVI